MDSYRKMITLKTPMGKTYKALKRPIMGKKNRVLSVVCFKRYLYLKEISDAGMATQRRYTVIQYL